MCRLKFWFSFLFLVAFPYFSLAQDLGFAIERYKGESSYIVSNQTQTLKSKLVFPFEFDTLGVYSDWQHKDIDYQIQLSTLIKDSVSVGRDYDWRNDNLSIFSNSNSNVGGFLKVDL